MAVKVFFLYWDELSACHSWLLLEKLEIKDYKNSPNCKAQLFPLVLCLLLCNSVFCFWQEGSRWWTQTETSKWRDWPNGRRLGTNGFWCVNIVCSSWSLRAALQVPKDGVAQTTDIDFVQFWSPEVQDHGASVVGPGEGPHLVAGCWLLILSSRDRRGQWALSVSLKRALMPCTRAPPSWPQRFLKVLPFNTLTLARGFQRMNFGETQTFRP